MQSYKFRNPSNLITTLLLGKLASYHICSSITRLTISDCFLSLHCCVTLASSLNYLVDLTQLSLNDVGLSPSKLEVMVNYLRSANRPTNVMREPLKVGGKPSKRGKGHRMRR